MRLYLSISRKVDEKTLKEFLSLLRSQTSVKIFWHKWGEEYDPKILESCDSMLILPEREKLPTTIGVGIYNEILSFSKKSSKIYIVSDYKKGKISRVNRSSVKVINTEDWKYYASIERVETFQDLGMVFPMKIRFV